MVNVDDLSRSAFPTVPQQPPFLRFISAKWRYLVANVGVAAIPRPDGFNYSHNTGVKAMRGLIKYIWHIAINDVTCVRISRGL
jgi:hypothetical protein